MDNQFTVVTGRSLDQGRGLHKGKKSEEYRQATTLVEMNAEDAVRLGVQDGQLVRVRTEAGQVDLSVVIDDQLPAGMVFIPMGPSANMLIGTDTDSSGMPHYKGLIAEVGQI